MADKPQTDDKKPADGPGAAQNPYPVDPSNELLDGDNIPTKEMLAESHVEVTDSGTALVSKDPGGEQDPTHIPPPQSANLERKKALEKHMVAAAESVGEFSVEGEAARAKAATQHTAEQSEAAEKRRLAAERDAADAKDDAAKAEAKKTPPQGRSARPTQKS